MDFTQWTGSQTQKDALRRIWELRKAIHEARRRAEEANSHLPSLGHELENSLWHLLRTETSCYVYWGEAWVSRAHSDLDEANRHLTLARDLSHGY